MAPSHLERRGVARVVPRGRDDDIDGVCFTLAGHHTVGSDLLDGGSDDLYILFLESLEISLSGRDTES